MKVIKITTEYINLGQFLKFSGVVFTGGEVRDFLLENDVYVNENRENRRGKKLFPGDLIEINNKKYILEGKNEH